MTKKDKALIVEGLNRICADVAALAAILESGTSGTVPHVPLSPIPPLSLPTDSNQEHGDGPACSTNVELQDRPQRSVAPASASQHSPVPTYEDVRAVLAEKARTGYRAEVKSLLTKHGVKQLSEITDPAEYAVLMKESEEIGDA